MTIQRSAAAASLLSAALFVLPSCSGNGSAASQLPSVAQPDSSLAQQATASTQTTLATAAVARSAADVVTSSVLTPASAKFVTEKPAEADTFVNAIGLDSAFNATNTPYVQNFGTISNALISLGVKHLRDGGGPNDGYLQRMKFLGSHGIYHSLGFLIPGTTAATIKAQLDAFAPYVDFVEPENEYDGNWRSDPNWVAHIRAEQTLIYDTVRGNSSFSGVASIGPSLSNVSNASKLGPIDSIEDGGNFHYATCDFNPATSGLYTYTGYLRASTQYKPIWSTETGYTDNLSRPCSTTDAIIAKYMPRTVAVRWNFGEPRIYFNQLADKPGDAVFGLTGLLRANGTPKPQYYTMQSMIGLLSDPGSTFTPRPLQYSLGGSTANVQHTLLQKRDGTYYLLVWLEVDSWDHQRRVPLNVPAQRVTLSLSSVPSIARYYTYGSNGRLVTNTLSRSTSISLSVTDQISFVELK